MATYITDECINCGACEPECPNDAISEGDSKYIIDAARCSECVGFSDSEKCQAVCPVECCLPDPNNKETEEVLLARAKQLEIPASDVLVEGAAAEAIVEAAHERGAALIVMGTHGRTGVRKMFLGSVAERVVATAPCPVLTVRMK